MAFCASCGAQMTEGTAFCGSCGAPVGGAAAVVTPVAASTGIASNVAGLLAYVLGPITGTIFLLVEPYRQDKFVRFHAFQSILYGIAAGVLFSIVGAVLSLISMLTLGIGALLYIPVYLLLSLLFFLYWLFLLYKAYNNERYMVPYIGTIAASASDMPAGSSNLYGFLAYVLWFITGIILLMDDSTKQDKFVRFHAYQSIFFSVAMFVLWIFYWIFGLVFGVAVAITGGFFLHLLVFLVFRLVSLAMYGYYLFIMSKAYQNELYKVPVIGDLAAKQAGV